MHKVSPAQQNVTRIIHDEHENLTAVISGMQYFMHAIAQGKKAPDLRVFRAMLIYLSDFPERVHHPKEDRFVFAQLRKRTSEMNVTLAELEFQHAQGIGLIHGIQHALARFEFEGMPAFPMFSHLVEEYARFYTAHMHVEENDVLAAAARYLTVRDWMAIEAAFSAIPDALTSALIKNDFTKLFSAADIPLESIGAANKPH